jgi:hypothetical protein
MKRSLTLRLSKFSLEALAGEQGQRSKQVQAKLARAVRLYLDDRDSGRPGWVYPGFLRDKEASEVELELVADEGLLRALEEEAGKQGVSVSQMAGHAALYYAAELNAGHLTQRILDDLGDDGEGGDS